MAQRARANGGRRRGDWAVLLGGRNRSAALRRILLEEFGNAATTEDVARHALEAGLYSAEEIARFALPAVQEDVRRALSIKDADGLPFAGPTRQRRSDESAGAPIWKARPLWTEDDYRENIAQFVAGRRELHDTAVNLARECFYRFGVAPCVPALEKWQAPK